MTIQIREMTQTDIDELYIGYVLREIYARGIVSKEDLYSLMGVEIVDASDTDLVSVTLDTLLSRYWVLESSGGKYSVAELGKLMILADTQSMRLNSIDFTIAMALQVADIPITALLAAAFLKADDSNKAVLRRNWGALYDDLGDRYMVGAVLPREARGEDDEAKRDNLALQLRRAKEIAADYLKRIPDPIRRL